jgi:hypothetical protein
MAYRQAYTPRWWITAIPVPLAAMVLAYFINPPLWILIPACALLGGGAAQIQWWVWKWRHPVVPPELVARRRAMWN